MNPEPLIPELGGRAPLFTLDGIVLRIVCEVEGEW